MIKTQITFIKKHYYHLRLDELTSIMNHILPAHPQSRARVQTVLTHLNLKSHPLRNRYQRLRIAHDLLLASFYSDGCLQCRSHTHLQAHHVIPSNKTDTIANLKYRKNVQGFLVELRKCIPLCPACHAEKHKN